MSPKASGNFVPLCRPSLGPEEEAAVVGVLRSGRLVQGPEVERFEGAFSRLTGSRHAVAVSSGTAALLLALEALGLGAGDEVVVPAYTFVATANAVRLAGAEVVPADVELESLNLDPASVAAVSCSRTAAVVPVHQFGLPADIAAIARATPGARVVEDAACATGAHTREGAIGRPHGDVAAFSFHPRKVMTTGEGGMLTTSDDDLAEVMRSLRQHGMDASGKASRAGYNFRMSEVAAAIGRVQIERLPGILDKRAQAAAGYRADLSGLEWLELPLAIEGHTYQSYVVRLRHNAPVKRSDLLTHLARHGVEAQAGVEPIHLHAPYRNSARVPLPVSEEAGRTALFLPMHAELEENDVSYVCDVIRMINES